jgi:hypothetical protein
MNPAQSDYKALEVGNRVNGVHLAQFMGLMALSAIIQNYGMTETNQLMQITNIIYGWNTPEQQ